MTPTPPRAWPGTVLRRPSAGYADLPTTRQPAIVRPDPTGHITTVVATAGRHRADDDTSVRDPRGWWWTTRPDPADWRPPPAPVDRDAPTAHLDPAAVTAAALTRKEPHR